jgi:soluble P-type ATPase
MPTDLPPTPDPWANVKAEAVWLAGGHRAGYMVYRKADVDAALAAERQQATAQQEEKDAEIAEWKKREYRYNVQVGNCFRLVQRHDELWRIQSDLQSEGAQLRADLAKAEAEVASLRKQCEGVIAMASAERADWQAEVAALTHQIAELTKIQPLHGTGCPVKPFEDSDEIPEGLDCTCEDLASRWKAIAMLDRAALKQAQAHLTVQDAEIARLKVAFAHECEVHGCASCAADAAKAYELPQDLEAQLTEARAQLAEQLRIVADHWQVIEAQRAELLKLRATIEEASQ